MNSFRKKMVLDLYQAHKKNQVKLHELKYLFWECTLRCNLNCKHCGSDCKTDPEQKDMPLEDFLRVLDELKEKQNPNEVMVVLTGGEPLLRKDLEACGKAFYERGFPWGIVSNGFGLDEKRFKSLLSAGIHSLSISLDGMETAHNWLRGNTNSFKHAIRAIRLAARAKSLVFDVVTVAHVKNLEDLPEMKKLLIHAGVKNWRIITIFPKGRARDNADFILGKKEFKELMEFIKNSRKEANGLDVTYGCEGFLGDYELEVRDHPFFCRAGINIGSVLADGSVSACPNLREDYIQGNIYTQNFMEIWNTKFQLMRNRDWTKIGKCMTCKHYKYCEGNALHLRDEKTGKLLLCHLDLLK